MSDGGRRSGKRRPVTPEPDDAWLTGVAQGASDDAGGVPVELLGDYLRLLADAATYGRQAERRELDAVALLGRRAAEQGVSARPGGAALPVRGAAAVERPADGGAQP
nr:hypothetical protein GCM10020092_059670 [Actinoplanes digitatis]